MNPFEQATPDQWTTIEQSLISEMIERNGTYIPRYTQTEIDNLKQQAKQNKLTDLLSTAADVFITNPVYKQNAKGIIELPFVKNIINQLGRRAKITQ